MEGAALDAYNRHLAYVVTEDGQCVNTLLVREGLVSRTDLGAGRAFFEPARVHAHHHVVCTSCGAVAHVHDEALGDVRARLEQATGYAVAGGEVSFFGLCPDCR